MQVKLQIVTVALTLLTSCTSDSGFKDSKLPAGDLAFLRQMTHDVVDASRVQPGSNGGGNCPVTNTCGFALVTPGKDTYQAFWPRDFSMALGSGFIGVEEIRNHLLLLCRVQNGDTERQLANGLHVPPWSIPDHVNYDSKPVWFPGTMNSGEDQGAGVCGRMPPIDDNYEFIHIAYVLWQKTHNLKLLAESVEGFSVFERLEKAFAAPQVDARTGLVESTEADRAIGFGFCDAEAHTGKLLFASLLRLRAAEELKQMCRALSIRSRVAKYSAAQQQIRANIPRTFCDPKIGGWLRASTGLSRQPDVWGTVYALEIGALDNDTANTARRTIVEAVKAGTITFEGGVRHVPTNFDFSASTSWERSLSPLNTYQNGGYWHTASGWLIAVLWNEDRTLALQMFSEMIAHLRVQDFRKGTGHGAPWEVFGPNPQALRNPVYMASVALPYSVLGNPRFH